MAKRITGILILAMVASISPAHAQNASPVLADSFPIGGGAMCEAQSRIDSPAVKGMFDRAWAVVCRDAGSPVGQVFAVRDAAGLDARIAKARRQAADCAPARQGKLADLGAVSTRNCRLPTNQLSYRIVRADRGHITYVAQGLASYNSALDLALRSIAADRIVKGEVDIATLGGENGAAFARMQAGNLDPDLLLAEGYRRNNSGSYAEAAEFFDSLQGKLAGDKQTDASGDRADRINRIHESLVNRALQLSNLGQFADADKIFARAIALPTIDPVQLRLRRNFRAIHRLNQQDNEGARAILDAPVKAKKTEPSAADGVFVVTPQIAAQANSGAGVIRRETELTPAERVAILDAQALGLRGTAWRLQGKPGQARRDMTRALAGLVAIRDGRVTSLTRLRAQLLDEIALTHETQRDYGAAERGFRDALALLQAQYPETVAMNGARARLAAFLVRRGQDAQALDLYRQVIASTTANQSDLTGVANQIEPYFALLAKEIPAQPDLAADLFLAGQTLVRPGAATTLEQLSRSLSSGTDTGARLFRQSISLSRDIERARITLAQLRSQPAGDPALAARTAAQQQHLTTLEAQKTAALTKLADYPQFRAVSKATISLADLQAMLHPGEAYFKLTQVGDALYAVYADSNDATGYRLPLGGRALARKVAAIRKSISTTVGGVQATYPFDVEDARALYEDIFGPVETRLGKVKHLIFEPDGAMLELPVNLLIAGQEGVDHYLAQRDQPGGDDFDFRGIDWLGRDRTVSTALSARSFRNARNAPKSTGGREYIGFGHNEPLSRPVKAAYSRSVNGSADGDCNWPPTAWSRPISAVELRDAAQVLRGGGADVVTGAAFTDQAVLGRGNLDQYRILHFATHGLIAPPKRGCPVQPALLTSFGGEKSDGLLAFDEIFNLKLDADMVILSACDTAAAASRSATRAAGIGTGGGTALDGLVRAFIGAGGREVIASHWPAPDQYNATRRLFTDLFQAPPGTSTGEAMRRAEIKLMDDPDTSHPFYWSGFAIIGDGARPLITKR